MKAAAPWRDRYLVFGAPQVGAEERVEILACLDSGLSVEEALTGMTLNAAASLGLAGEIGSLAGQGVVAQPSVELLVAAVEAGHVVVLAQQGEAQRAHRSGR